MKSKDSKSIKGYVPPDAEINFSSNPMPPPPTKYDKRMVVFNEEEVKKLVKGNYGKEEK